MVYPMEKIENKELDLLITYASNHPNFITEPIFEERLVIAMPKSQDSYRKIHLAYNSFSKNNPLIKNFIRVAKDIYSAK